MTESNDLRRQLSAVHDRLVGEFGDQVGAEAVSSMVNRASADLANASITGFVPMLVEKSVRAQLRDRD